MKTIYTNKGQPIIVDDEDYEELNGMSWHLNEDGYAVRHFRKNGKVTEFMHRRLLGLPVGDPTKGDHKNNDPADNQKDNLRPCTHQQNICNRKLNSNNTAGLKGVTWYPKYGKWLAQIQSNKKRKTLGYFGTVGEAHEAYCRAAIALHGEFANFGANSPMKFLLYAEVTGMTHAPRSNPATLELPPLPPITTASPALVTTCSPEPVTTKAERVASKPKTGVPTTDGTP